MKQIRQGDILLIAVSTAIPEGAMPKPEVVLAEGELTGHVHRLAGVAVYDWSDPDGQRYVAVREGGGLLSHEDHDPVAVAVLEPGIVYRVVPQQECGLGEQWRKVVD